MPKTGEHEFFYFHTHAVRIKWIRVIIIVYTRRRVLRPSIPRPSKGGQGFWSVFNYYTRIFFFFEKTEGRSTLRTLFLLHTIALYL